VLRRSLVATASQPHVGLQTRITLSFPSFSSTRFLCCLPSMLTFSKLQGLSCSVVSFKAMCLILMFYFASTALECWFLVNDCWCKLIFLLMISQSDMCSRLGCASSSKRCHECIREVERHLKESCWYDSAYAVTWAYDAPNWGGVNIHTAFVCKRLTHEYYTLCYN